MNCVISSINATKNFTKIRSVTLPALNGEMQILSEHARTFVVLKNGDIIVESIKRKKNIIKITEGGCYVDNNRIVIVL